MTWLIPLITRGPVESETSHIPLICFANCTDFRTMFSFTVKSILKNSEVWASIRTSNLSGYPKLRQYRVRQKKESPPLYIYERYPKYFFTILKAFKNICITKQNYSILADRYDICNMSSHSSILVTESWRWLIIACIITKNNRYVSCFLCI